MKFNCPFSPDPLQLLPRTLTQLYTYLEKLLQISSFCQRSLELLALCGGKGSGDLHWKLWEELEVTRCTCIVQQADKLMILNQDFFFLGGEGTFCFFWRMGSVSCSLIPDDCFWSKEGWWHWHIPPGKAPWVSEGLPELRLRNLALLVSRAGTVKDLQTPSPPQASYQPWAAAAAALHWGCPYPPLPSCDNVCWLGQAIGKRL